MKRTLITLLLASILASCSGANTSNSAKNDDLSQSSVSAANAVASHNIANCPDLNGTFYTKPNMNQLKAVSFKLLKQSDNTALLITDYLVGQSHTEIVDGKMRKENLSGSYFQASCSTAGILVKNKGNTNEDSEIFETYSKTAAGDITYSRCWKSLPGGKTPNEPIRIATSIYYNGLNKVKSDNDLTAEEKNQIPVAPECL